MTVFIALLRAVNVGGTGKLPMNDLERLCEEAGSARSGPRSGNVVFDSDGPEAEVRAALEAQLKDYAGKPVGHNPVLKAYYQRLRARGKDHKVALIACMRSARCAARRPGEASLMRRLHPAGSRSHRAPASC